MSDENQLNFNVNTSLKQIIIIIIVSSLLGLVRFFLLEEDFNLIKKKRVLEETKSNTNDLGEKFFKIPDLMTEPMIASLEFSKYFFDTKKAIFIDARDLEEYNISHIAGAINIPFDYYDEYSEIIDNLNYDDLFIIYCSGGECSLSIDLADVLFDELAFENVFVFEGGLPEWQKAGYPVE